MKYPLTGINSANDSAGVWVAIGYRTKDRVEHALFIVAGEETNAKATGRSPEPIYFERDDQSLSCYEGAERIVVSKRSITLVLNKNGRNSLEMPKDVEFVADKILPNFIKAKSIFAEMKKRKSGEIIEVIS
jgi:hypothetical protein